MRISNFKRLAIAALAAGTALAVTPADAATLISLGYSLNGGAITTLATDSGTGFVSFSSNNSAVPGYFVSFDGSGTPLLLSPNAITDALTVKAAGTPSGLLSLFITEQGLNSFTGTLVSTLSSNTLTGSAASATVTTSTSAANLLYSGTTLQSNLFTGLGTFAGSNSVNMVSPWSETIRYDINFNGTGDGTFNGNANIAAPIPEPATWAMMLIGFGMIGFAARRRGRQTVRVAYA